MAQNDLIISNQSFPSFRQDLNLALQAINSNHSGSTTPSGAVAGTIWLDTTNATIPLLKYYDGVDNITLATINHSTNTVTFSGVSTDLVNDLTPQLGGDLDVQTNKVVTTANRNVLVYPNGTGVLEVGGSTNSGRIQLNCEQNTHGIKLASPPHSAGQSYTLTFPTTAPTANKVLQTDGSGNLSFASVSGGIEWQAVHTSATLSATANYGYFLNTTSNAITVTLPASPVIGNQIALVDYAGTFDTNALIINPNGNKIEGATANLTLTGEREGVLLTFTDATQGWIATSGINEGTDALSVAPYAIDFLVIAGGGGGGNGFGTGDYASGAGGAGGYRTSTQTVTAGTAITVTVGDGGSGTNPAVGVSGSNSSISGAGLSTITSNGGGGGGNSANNGVNGGSAGGGGAGQSGGTGNTPSTSPSQGNNGGAGVTSGNTAGGGGGGATGIGSNGNGATSTGGNGGAGTTSSITGSSVTRAGGGGGGAGYTPTAGTAGGTATGGGGNGSATATGSAGTANTGGGGGGSRGGQPAGGNGGKGVVILSMPLANFSGTTTGSPTASDDGTTKRLVFNGSGSYTT